MSATIDERVVEMRFDNRDFEQNIKTSLNTIEVLKNKLNVFDSAKHLANLSDAAKKVDFSTMEAGVSTVHAKFSAFEVMAITALSNITNHAMYAGKKMMDALTVEPLYTGFQEYELKMGSVQTIMASTGASLETVNKYLEELNTYSDKTIYSFSDMTNNIGKFTNAGVSLDQAVLAIKGVSNEAAISGANANEASRAMYNFAQALSAGYVKLIDWKSIENANMATVDFKNQLLETALACGTVEKTSDGMYKTLTKNAQGKVSEAFDATHGFNEALANQWMTTEVLVSTLGKYADETTDIGKKAYSAAQDVKTFSMMMDTLKEAAQSGWSQTWELIFGDFEEAKTLWTGLAETIGGTIDASSKARNNLLEGSLESNFEKLSKEIVYAGGNVDKFKENIKEIYNSKNSKNIGLLIKQYGSLDNAIMHGAISTDILKEAIMNATDSAKNISIADELHIGDINDDVKTVQQALKDLGGDFGDIAVDGVFGEKTEAAIKAFQKANGMEITGIVDSETIKALSSVTNDTIKWTDSFDNLLNNIDGLGGREKLIDSFKNAFNGVARILGAIGRAWKEVFPPLTSTGLTGIIDGIYEFSEKLKVSGKTALNIKNIFKGLFSIIDIFFRVISGIGKTAFSILSDIFHIFSFDALGALASIGKLISKFNEWLKTGNSLTEKMQTLTSTFHNFVTGLKRGSDDISNSGKKMNRSFGESLLSLGQSIKNSKIFTWIQSLTTGIKDLIINLATQISNGLKNAFDSFKNGDFSGVTSILDVGAFGAIAIAIGKFIKKLTSIKNTGSGIVSNIKEIADGLSDAFGSMQDAIDTSKIVMIAITIGILTLALIALSGINKRDLTKAIGAITILFGELLAVTEMFNKMDTSNNKGILKTAASLILIAISIGVLAKSVKTLSDLNWEQLGKGLIGVAALLLEVVGFLKIVDTDNKRFLSAALGMIMVGAAIRILASSCKVFADMSWEQIEKGLASVGLLLLELSIFSKMTSGSKKMISVGLSMIMIGAAMKILASAVNDFGKMSWKQIGKGLTAIGGSLLIIAGVMRIMPKKKMISMSIGVLILGAALKSLVGVMKDANAMSWEQIGKGLATIGGTLLIIAIACNMMQKDGMIKLGIGLLFIASALNSLSETMNKIGAMSWEQIGKGLAGIAGLLIELSIALNIMRGTLAGSAALLVAAISLNILIPVLKALGGMAITDIVKALGALAGVFIILGVAGLVLSPLVGPILALAGAITLIGAGAALFGVGLLAIGAGFTAISVGLTALVGTVTGSETVIVSSIIAIVTGVSEALPVVIEKLGEGFVAFLNVISESAPEIQNAFVALINMACGALNETIPTIVDTLFSIISQVLDTLTERIPELSNSLFNTFIALINSLSEHVPDLINAGAELLSNVFGGILEAIGTIIGDFISGIGEGLTNGLPEIGNNIKEFMSNLSGVEDASEILSVVKTIGAVLLEISAASFIDSLNIIGGIKEAITGTSSTVRMLKNLGEGLMAFNNETEEITDVSKITALTSAAYTIATASQQLAGKGGIIQLWEGAKDFGTFGDELITFGQGLSSLIGDPVLKNFDDTMKTQVETMMSAVSSIITTNNELAPSGGVVQWFSGEKDLGKFGTNLQEFATGLAWITSDTSMTSFSEEDANNIITLMTAVGGIIDANKEIDSTGGILNWFTGEKNLGDFGTNLGTFADGLKEFSQKTNDIEFSDILAMEKIMTGVSKILSATDSITVSNDFIELGSKLSYAADDLNHFFEVLKPIDMGDDLLAMGNISSLLSSLLTVDPSGFDVNLGLITATLGDFATEINKIDVDDISSKITGLVEALNGITVTNSEEVDSLSGIAGSLTESFSTSIEGSSESIAASAGTIMTALQNGMTSKQEEVNTTFQNLISKMLSSAQSTVAEASATGSSVMSEFSSGLSVTTGTVDMSSMTNAMNDSLKSIRNSAKDFSEQGGKLSKGFVEGISSNMKSIATYFLQPISTAISRIKSNYNGFYNSGKYLATGFATGIRDHKSAAVNEAVRMVEQAIKAMNEKAKIHSPSKVTYEAGSFFGEGFVNAIGDYASKARAASSAMAEEANKGMLGVMNYAKSLMDDGMNVEPTIRPVLDASSIREGINSVNSMLDFQSSVGLNPLLGSVSSYMSGRQNDPNGDVINAINGLKREIGKVQGNSYIVGNVTYDDGSNIGSAVEALVRAARVERRA